MHNNQLLIYSWQQSHSPEFRYKLQNADNTLSAFAEETGLITGRLTIPEDMQMEARIDIMIAVANKTFKS
jgi:hypothetical protein